MAKGDKPHEHATVRLYVRLAKSNQTVEALRSLHYWDAAAVRGQLRAQKRLGDAVSEVVGSYRPISNPARETSLAQTWKFLRSKLLSVLTSKLSVIRVQAIQVSFRRLNDDFV